MLVAWRVVIRTRIELYREVRRRSVLFDHTRGPATTMRRGGEGTTTPAFLREWSNGLNLGMTIVAPKDYVDNGDGGGDGSDDGGGALSTGRDVL